MDVLEFMRNPELCGDTFTGDSWQTWDAITAAAFGLPLDDDQLETFTRLAGGRKPPEKRVSEFVVIAGRRSAKTHRAAGMAVYLATVGAELDGLTEKLSTGERGVIALIATDRNQAAVSLNYIRGLFEQSPALAGMVERYTSDSIELRNRVVIQVTTASYRAIRGRTLLAVLMDEACFFRSESTANPDVEIYRAAVPGLATTGGMLIVISSPYAKKGLVYSRYQKHYGKDSDCLVIKGGTKDFNPTLDKRVIDEAMQDDPEAAASEWYGEFRNDIAAFIDRDLLQDLARTKPPELPYDRSQSYQAFIDPAGGGKDEFCLAIGHKERGQDLIVVDVLKAQRGSPAEIAKEYAEVMKAYKVRTATSDKYAGQWPADEFQRHGIRIEYSDCNRSQLYQHALPILNTGRVELPNDPKLLNQFAGLERRTSRSGVDKIDHPVGGSDDRANATAGLIYIADRKPVPAKCVRIAF
ncbi:hypothetical protein Q5L94_01985 [Idiomarina sp. Sol25]|uniref:hypothetical protein n=1 Tax=Idiomarina sp. Sol25 TaxID=3064000 RepID=UPI00294AFDD2|nr:hypothetical protein [Idiomarina sp. Sol25]MDV6326813.1 hypothetical protein [Idiomarina sp. Sol25]